MVSFGPLAAEIGLVVLEPQQISTGFASWQLYCTVLQQWASAKLFGVEQMAPPIFGRATIMLGIGPHSSHNRRTQMSVYFLKPCSTAIVVLRNLIQAVSFQSCIVHSCIFCSAPTRSRRPSTRAVAWHCMSSTTLVLLSLSRIRVVAVNTVLLRPGWVNYEESEDSEVTTYTEIIRRNYAKNENKHRQHTKHR